MAGRVRSRRGLPSDILHPPRRQRWQLRFRLRRDERFVGVYETSRGGYFYAVLGTDTQEWIRGTFQTGRDAAVAYDDMARAYYGSAGVTNFETIAPIATALAAWSREVRARTGGRCATCGSTEDVHAHHVLPKSKHPDRILDPANGIPLCRRCHARQHPEVAVLNRG